MPASLFLPANRLELAAYAEVTIQGYHVSQFSGDNATKLKLGRCKNLKPVPYPVCGASIQGIGWTPSSLMKPACLAKCGCTWPSCPDVADQPKAGKFCSLCGRTSACPGCTGGTVTIGLCYLKPAGKTIVDLAVATKNLSTLVAALKAADLVGTLSGTGPFTVFAPTNEAFAALPAGVLANLLKPENKAELVDLLTYHVAAGDVQAEDITDQEQIKTLEGDEVTARKSPGSIFINSAKVIGADNDASNGVVHIIDGVLIPPAQAPAPSTNHLYFYWKNPAYIRCGDVDAAPRMPASLFEPENKDALQAYINATIDLFHITDGNPSDPQRTQLKQGTCKENGYGTLLPGCPSRDPGCAYPNPIISEWAPKVMMKAICDLRCNCNYPNCKDVPDDPKTKHWCSLCGPKYNAPINVTLYNPSGHA